jgi:zinc D-Ala-D-Ala carboxypeptidase
MPRVKVKPRHVRRFRALGVALLLAACSPPPQPAPKPPEPWAGSPSVSRAPDRGPPSTWPPAAGCQAPQYAAAAAANAASLDRLTWAPYRRPEIGWRVYAPRIGREIRSPCPPESAGFARALADWQRIEGLPGGGRLDAVTFDRVRAKASAARPFAQLRGRCPAPPAPGALAAATPREGYGGKAIALRAGALAAYRRMVAAAYAESAEIRADSRNLTIFSGFRPPELEAERCLRFDCDGVTRARCSAHRTGLALDLYVGHAPGYGPDSSADPNRLHQTHTPTYRWLLANAGRFGFVDYPFEPWHWEWTGEPP